MRVIIKEKVSWNNFFKNVILYTSDELAEKFENGIAEDLKRYVKQNYPAAVYNEEDPSHINVDLLGDMAIFCKKYYQKREADYSTKDIVDLSYKHIRRMGTPPLEAMSQESVQKKISQLLNSPEYERNVYIRHGKGGHSLYCVDFDTAMEIAAKPEVQNLINKQIRKAEKGEGVSENWRRYELEKQHIESKTALIEAGELQQPYLSRDEEMFLMVKALYSLFFTDFDIDTYEKDITDLEALESAQDYGKDYQELDKVLRAPNFDWKYYQVKESSLLDVLADKIAEKVLERLTDKREES